MNTNKNQRRNRHCFLSSILGTNPLLMLEVCSLAVPIFVQPGVSDPQSESLTNVPFFQTDPTIDRYGEQIGETPDDETGHGPSGANVKSAGQSQDPFGDIFTSGGQVINQVSGPTAGGASSSSDVQIHTSQSASARAVFMSV